MLYTKQNLAVVEGASKDENRPVLNGVLLDKSGETVATNGHVLFRVGKAITPDDEFPSTGQKATKPKDQIISASDIRDITTKIPKGRSIPILQHCQLIKNEKEDRAAFITTDLDAMTIHDCRLIEGPYPNYQASFDDLPKKPVFEIMIGNEVLEALVRFVKKAKYPDATISFKFYGPTRVITFDVGQNEGDQKVDGMLMPRRTNE